MEALRELERVQRVLSLMSSRGLCDTGSSGGGAAADRFLAQFLLFMVQPSESLTMENKFLLVSELLGKATPDTMEEVHHLTHLEGSHHLEADQNISSGALLQPNKKFKMHAEKSTIQAVPMVGFDAMTRAKSTLEDFCRSYFMFHGLDANNPQSIFKYLPVLSFTESYIYQLDASNEDSLNLIPDNRSSSKELERKKEAFDETSLSQMIEPLDSFLQNQGLMTDRLQTELKSGIQYWSLERKLCQALTRNEKISIDDVMKAIHLKSFDYRVLNLLMYQLTGQQVNELHMDFLSISEFLVEISDDLYDYEDDVINNTFNILRMFAAIYGPSEAPNMLAKCIGEAEEKYESFSKKLDPSLSGSCWRRCEEATKEGGKISGHAYGTWNIPSVISDEESFRRERTSKHDASTVII
ncbi:hypothetical protein SETIT_7G118700v2 [Setaria italica]|uniref:Uncharacterized protein n=1 Tax=Setaria italica TaxID=4555 RepID=A0A368RUJ3_SETIT|nr:uncharacterized protein LOC101757237 isoform X1 [Setaria italica]RCV33886.1 hypothetical protein SETIT_7G118700v2 [Setaria italica]